MIWAFFRRHCLRWQERRRDRAPAGDLVTILILVEEDLHCCITAADGRSGEINSQLPNPGSSRLGKSTPNHSRNSKNMIRQVVAVVHDQKNVVCWRSLPGKMKPRTPTLVDRSGRSCIKKPRNRGARSFAQQWRWAILAEFLAVEGMVTLGRSAS